VSQSSQPSPQCKHCGLPISEEVPDGAEFCCSGCQAAYQLLNGLGLETYYDRKVTDPNIRPLKPEEQAVDLSAEVHSEAEANTSVLNVVVDGLHCAACVWLVETLLRRHEAVTVARLNMTTRRLRLEWTGPADLVNDITAPVQSVGYRLLPFHPECLKSANEAREKFLLRAMAVAGFAAANVMLLSVSVWAGSDMGPATRDLMHWVSALIALPAIAYAIRPFLIGAWGALRFGRVNMDVPIVLAVLLAAGMSLWETINSGAHAYFDSAISLLFFLLIGRYLDSRARGRARASAENLLMLSAVAVDVEQGDGTVKSLSPDRVRTGQVVRVAPGDRFGIDGVIIEGASDVDTQAISGETTPFAVQVGDVVHAGTQNLSGLLRVRVSAAGESTVLADIVRMMESAEQGRAQVVAVADRAARLYAPVVHTLALLAFGYWWGVAGMEWQSALLIAVSVLIITCPCALALAVPAVQVIASGRLFKRGTLLKSATALERLQQIDTVVFDKTGTLTFGHPILIEDLGWDQEQLYSAASVAAGSRHPLARALVHAAKEQCGDIRASENLTEVPGSGILGPAGRLGRYGFVLDDDTAGVPEATGPELWWLPRGERNPIRFQFTQNIRHDSAETVTKLQALGIQVLLLSGDSPEAVRIAAEQTGIKDWTAQCKPGDKVARLNALKESGKTVAMVGDGLNDAPALAAAHVSMSPATAVDLAQNAADVVFQGDMLGPVLETIQVARRAAVLVRENFGLAIVYNLITIPVAMAGYVTPLIAAVAMSTSSIVVMLNALRLGRAK